MRALVLGLILASGCTETVLDENTTYRRLQDQFDSKEQCLAEGDFTPCFQTLLLCSDGRARMDLESSPQRGTYQLHGNIAVAAFIQRTIDFDLDTARAEDLPGRHPWERVEPIFASCDD
ncbi:MAG: hypothetical protein H0V17_09185 [Deltaproteobacteria bacterium]|nr:hypothetical protein [Deltaproteobacteria bacterium]